MPEIIPNLHPFAVHFPIALVSLSAFVHVAALVMQNRPQFAAPCAVIAHSTLWLSALAVLIAVIYGLQAFNSVHHDDVSHAAMLPCCHAGASLMGTEYASRVGRAGDIGCMAQQGHGDARVVVHVGIDWSVGRLPSPLGMAENWFIVMARG